MCKKAYKRLLLLTKLKYVGVKKEDLIDIYKLFIRSVLEYCSTVFHSSLTKYQSKMIENVQVLCSKIICGSEYTDYPSALLDLGLSSLQSRRENRILSFSKKCLQHPVHHNMFPLSDKFQNVTHNIRNLEKFSVNNAKTDSYKSSFIPVLSCT